MGGEGRGELQLLLLLTGLLLLLLRGLVLFQEALRMLRLEEKIKRPLKKLLCFRFFFERLQFVSATR